MRGMVIDMNDEQLHTLGQMQVFVDGTETTRFTLRIDFIVIVCALVFCNIIATGLFIRWSPVQNWHGLPILQAGWRCPGPAFSGALAQLVEQLTLNQ